MSLLSVLPIVVAAIFVIGLIVWALSRVSGSDRTHFDDGSWNNSSSFYSPTEPFTDLHDHGHHHHQHDPGPGFGAGDFGGNDPGGPGIGGVDFGGPDFGGSDFGGLDFGGSDFGGSDFGSGSD